MSGIMKFHYPHSLIQDLQHNNLVPFVGSGFSVPSGLPTWNTLISELVEDYESDFNDPTLRQLVEKQNIDSIDSPMLYEILTRSRYQLRRFLANKFGLAYTPNEYHNALARLHLDVIITTNFDNLLERSFESNGYRVNKIWKDEHLNLYNEKRSLQIIKMHGTLEDINNLVISREDYASYRDKHRLMFECVKFLFTTRTVLFLGFSLTDPNVTNLLEELRASQQPFLRTHFAVLPNPDRQITRHLQEYGINVIPIPSENLQSNLSEWLQGLSQTANMEGRSNIDKAEMINSALRENLKRNIPGSTIRYRAALGILSTPKEVNDDRPLYGDREQDALEQEMGNLVRRHLNASARNMVRGIMHLNPQAQLSKGYNKSQLKQRINAIKEYIEKYGEQVDIAFSSAPITLNHFIIDDEISFITHKRGLFKGYDSVQTTRNRWVIRSEIGNFDNDFDAILLENKKLASGIGIDVTMPSWRLHLRQMLVDAALASLKSDSTVLQCQPTGEILQPVSRQLAHETGILHKSVHLHLFDLNVSEPRVLVQRRSAFKDLYALKVDASVAGHQETDNSLEEILRETAEELRVWLATGSVRKLYQFERSYENDHEIVDVYYANVTDQVSSISRNFSDEADEIIWVQLADLLNRDDSFGGMAYRRFASNVIESGVTLQPEDFTPYFIDELRTVAKMIM